MEQCTDSVFMVQPVSFGFNTEAAVSNHFQKNIDTLSASDIQSKALVEFNQLKDTLVENGINVIVYEDTETPLKPDAIFPNNWISINNERIIVYPMCNANRRTEKRKEIIEALHLQAGIDKLIDLSHYEEENTFLEGTGSIVFDHQNKLAYACISERTNEKLLKELCSTINYSPIVFNAFDENNNPIYHTNVMMSIAPDFAVICLESISNNLEKEKLIQLFKKNKKEIIDISFHQVNCFVGNMLTLKGINGLLQVMSKNAYNSLTKEQLTTIKKYAQPLVADITTIETIGGGGVRCMIAEIYS